MGPKDMTLLAPQSAEQPQDRILRQNKASSVWRFTDANAAKAHNERKAKIPTYWRTPRADDEFDVNSFQKDKNSFEVDHPAYDRKTEHYNQSLPLMDKVVRNIDSGKATAEDLYRSYKSSAHRPAAVMAKYIVHRLNNLDAYEDPKAGHELDKKFLAQAQMGGAAERNGHLAIKDLHDWIGDNPHLIQDMIAHRDATQRDILHGVGLNVRTINGAPHVALTRGLNSDIMTMEHPLSSWADKPDTGFGNHMHQAWVPLKDVWFGFPHFKHDYCGGSHENEYVVGSSLPKYEATAEDVKEGRPSSEGWTSGELYAVPTGTHRDEKVHRLSDSATDEEIAEQVAEALDGGNGVDKYLKHKNAGTLTWKALLTYGAGRVNPKRYGDLKVVPREVALEQIKGGNWRAIGNPNLKTEDLVDAANNLNSDDMDDYHTIMDHPNSDSRVAKSMWNKANASDPDTAEALYKALAEHHTTPPEALNGILSKAEVDDPAAASSLKFMYTNPHFTEDMAGRVANWFESKGMVPEIKYFKHAPVPDSVVDKQIELAGSTEHGKVFLGESNLQAYVTNPRAKPEEIVKVLETSPSGLHLELGNVLARKSDMPPAVLMYLAKKNVAPVKLARRNDLTPEVVGLLALHPNPTVRELLFHNKSVKPEWLRAAWPKSEPLPAYEKEESLEGHMREAQDAKEHLGYAIQAREAYAKRRLRDHMIKPLPEGIWKSEENPADLMFRAEIEHWLAQKESQNLGWLAVVPEENIHDIVEHNVLHPQPNERLLEGKAVVVQPNRPHILEALHHGLQPGEVVVRFSTDQDPRPYGPGQFFFPDAVAVQGPEVLASNLRKDEKDPLVDLNLMNEEQVEEWELEMAATMLGENPVANKALAAAHFMARNHEPDFERYSLALRVFQDFNRAALYAYQIPDTEENLKAIVAVQKVGGKELSKAEAVAQKVSTVVPVMPEAAETAQELRRAAAAGLVKPLKLNGRHSKGAMAAKDPRTKKAFLIKPGSGRNSPAAGVREEKASQSRREVAAWQVAQLMGLGDVVPRADLIELDGKEVAAIKLLDPTFKPLDEKNKAKEQLAAEVLAPYLANTQLHRWAIYLFIIGESDAHGQNILVDEKGRVALIDHGSAFAGKSYSPAHDKSSFIPYVLRAWGPLDFMQHDPQERMKFMPVLTRDLDAELRAWLESIDPLKLGHTIHRYGIDPKPALTRLQVLRDARGSLSRTVNALFAGAKV